MKRNETEYNGEGFSYPAYSAYPAYFHKTIKKGASK